MSGLLASFDLKHQSPLSLAYLPSFAGLYPRILILSWVRRWSRHWKRRQVFFWWKMKELEHRRKEAMGNKVWVRYTEKALGSWSPVSAWIPITAQRPTCPALADLSPPGGHRSRPQGCGSWPDSLSFGGPTFHHPSPMETISTLHLMTHQTSWKITFPTNPHVFFVFHLLLLVPCPLLFESTFSAVAILYFVLKHTFLSCHCIHQWQGLYSFMYFASNILFVFHTSVCLKAWGVQLPFFFHPNTFFLCRHCSFLH